MLVRGIQLSGTGGHRRCRRCRRRCRRRRRGQRCRNRWRDGESQSWGTRLDFGAKRVIWSYLVQNAGPPFLFLYFVSEFSV